MLRTIRNLNLFTWLTVFCNFCRFSNITGIKQVSEVFCFVKKFRQQWLFEKQSNMCCPFVSSTCGATDKTIKDPESALNFPLRFKKMIFFRCQIFIVGIHGNRATRCARQFPPQDSYQPQWICWHVLEKRNCSQFNKELYVPNFCWRERLMVYF